MNLLFCAVIATIRLGELRSRPILLHLAHIEILIQSTAVLNNLYIIPFEVIVDLIVLKCSQVLKRDESFKLL